MIVVLAAASFTARERRSFRARCVDDRTAASSTLLKRRLEDHQRRLEHPQRSLEHDQGSTPPPVAVRARARHASCAW